MLRHGHRDTNTHVLVVNNKLSHLLIDLDVTIDQKVLYRVSKMTGGNKHGRERKTLEIAYEQEKEIALYQQNQR